MLEGGVLKIVPHDKGIVNREHFLERRTNKGAGGTGGRDQRNNAIFVDTR